MTHILDDWQPEGTLQYPHASKLMVDGSPLMEGRLTSARFNLELKEEVFKKPAE